ncbi:DNA transposase THAP9 [Nymphon striatum]|nr:DNA transposase THAP9 [Nymphon striatum]
MTEEISCLKKKLKNTQQKNRRFKTRVQSLKTIIKCLKDEHLISSVCEEILSQSFSGASLKILKRAPSGKGSFKGRKCSANLRSFAMTLQFYSAKGYEFVRKTFNLALPHQSQIRKWYSKVPAEPGFTEPAFHALQASVVLANENGQQVLCSRLLDEMAIRKHLEWDGKKFRGYVDLGNGVDNVYSLPFARDALLLMVVSLNGSWKIPCGYFFVDGYLV